MNSHVCQLPCMIVYCNEQREWHLKSQLFNWAVVIEVNRQVLNWLNNKLTGDGKATNLS